MRQLNEELTSTENKVAFARQAFNDAVMHYNNARQAFPAVLIARMLGFPDAAFLEIEGEEHHTAPSLSFDTTAPKKPKS
jgi:LemA protein